ncbi:MAG: DUF262 domain-containing protein [Pseudomonadota bacterium]
MLESQVMTAGRKVSTDSITMSFGEVANYYKEGDLNINPEFQRAFRWSVQKKSNLIESLLLSIPLPSIFVFEDKGGKWELVDGLQRLSTVFEFMGILREPESDELRAPSRLVSTKYLNGLEGAVWNGAEQEDNNQLPVSLQRKIRTSRLQVEILRYPSDTDTKYDLFQRLNRGGETANAQEVRNCLCVMANSEGFSEVKAAANDSKFLELVRLTDTAVEQQRHLEWLMRIMVHSKIDYDGRLDVENFIDNGMRDILEKEQQNSILNDVKRTFELLAVASGDVALLPSLGAGGSGNRVSLRQIEAIAVGISRNVSQINELQDPASFISRRLIDFWKQPEVEKMSAAGLSPTQRIPRTVPFGATWFDPSK